MITQTPVARELYEARMKAKLIKEARLEFARTEGQAAGRAEGRAAGRAEGELIGQIRLLEQFLGMTPTASDELAK